MTVFLVLVDAKPVDKSHATTSESFITKIIYYANRRNVACSNTNIKVFLSLSDKNLKAIRDQLLKLFLFAKKNIIMLILT